MRRLVLLVAFVFFVTATLRAADATLRFLEARVASDTGDFISWNRLADTRLRLLASTGRLEYLRAAAEAVEQTFKVSTPDINHGGLAARAHVELAAHRFGDSRKTADQLVGILTGSPAPLQQLGDALLNLGDYDACKNAWDRAVAADANPIGMEPRLAQLDLIHGRVAKATERLTAALEAAKNLTPPSPETVAWLEVQRGEIAFRSGDWDAAETSYDAALAAQPDYWAVLDHLAELRGAQGKLDEAVALYTKVITTTERPELMQALGDLYLFAGKREEAKRWHERALAGYLASVEKGEVLFFHHLAGFYADSVEDPEKAVEWAEKDAALRHGIQADDSLAWALQKAGKLDEALALSKKARLTGTRDAHILYHAGMIEMSSGEIAAGKSTLKAAFTANPRYNTFHVHR